MGFLDHSTNNIIVDAVLTDTGRLTLAKNDGSFVISKFAFGDDEVDYGIIQKFGPTVGKEKITKNTPIFEAQTNGDLALKYRLLSVSVPDLIVLPTLAISLTTMPSGNTNLFTKGTSGEDENTATVTQATTLTTVPTDLVDSAFVIQYDNRFLNVSRESAGGTSTKSVSNNVATITVAANDVTTSGGGTVTIRVGVAGFALDFFNTYSTGGTPPVIKTQVQISGRASGATVTQEYSIIS
jgi:hypothetical protein